MAKEEASRKTNPQWTPQLVTIIGYDGTPVEQYDYQSVLKKISDKYGALYSEGDENLDFKDGSVNCFLSKGFTGEVEAAVIALKTTEAVNRTTPSHTTMKMEDFLKDLKNLMPKPNFENTIKVFHSNKLEEIETTLPKSYKDLTLIENAGRLKNCILAYAPSLTNEGEYILVHPEEPITAHKVWKILSELIEISHFTWEMSHLYSNRHLMFEQIDASEKNTQYRINEILADMRRPVDELQPEDLEDVLREITIQFSRLSTMAGSMRRDLIKAKSLRRSLEEILDEWAEKTYMEYRTNSSALLNHMDGMMAPFNDFIERVEALMTQLNTVLDSVRTYLSIQQQKISITQQAASKNQLVKLVNLQEILHKLEVLIVAVYLTEIFKTIIEAATHENIQLYTALFIPIALLASMFLARILHKTPEQP